MSVIEIIIAVITLFLGGVLGGILAWLWASRSTSAKQATMQAQLDAQAADADRLNEQLAEARSTLEGVRADLVQEKQNNASLKTELDQQRQQADEKLKLLKEAKEAMQADFKNLANEIFAAKQKEFKEQSKEQLTVVLNPLKEKIQSFEKQVKDAHTEDLKGRTSLLTELKHLKELNSQIAQDAVNLTNALKGEAQTQGAWGEMILERLLEESGLEKGREYEVQVSLKTEDGGRQRPDVIVRLPEGKDVIIDSKVSLTAYERFCSAEDEAEREAALKQHVQSMTSHFRDLAGRDYQKLEGVRTLDFVLMFVPIEAAFAAAATADQNLFSDALARKIAIVTPTTLLVTLRTIENTWSYERQNQNAQEIAKRAGALYDKFVGFVDDLADVGKRIDSAKSAWEGAHNKLTSGKGNLVSRAEQIKALGAKASKSLPASQVDDAGIEFDGNNEVL